MSFYFAQLAKVYPKFAPTWAKTVEAKYPSGDIRRQLWDLRFQYWYRKFASINPTLKQAKVDACGVVEALKNPGQITYQQIGTGLVWGVHIVGAFTIGEIFGRKQLAGYPVGDWYKAPHIADAHH